MRVAFQSCQSEVLPESDCAREERMSVSESERREAEPPDNLCERCGYPKARLVYDEANRLLLCEQCVAWMKSKGAWCCLPEAEAG
jgi:hypothetical protein